MSDLIVINTGPLIALARIGAIDLVANLPYRFVCPQEVRDELDDGQRLGYPAVQPVWLEVRQLRAPLSRLAVAALDKGEAAVIQMALEEQAMAACIDEWKGRRAALAAGLEVTGVLGLLGMAKNRGLIAAVRPYVEKAATQGIRYDRELVARFLSALNE